MSLHAKLATIQKELNAPKNQHNKFGGYNYRSCEDILMAVKPLLCDLAIIISDEIVMLGDRFYVKATAVITDGKERIESTAYAREEATKKGMDSSQITGSTSSYARKYALNGLLLIDDNKDADSHDNREERKQEKPAKPPISDERLTKAIETILAGEYTTTKLRAAFSLTQEQEQRLMDALAQTQKEAA